MLNKQILKPQETTQIQVHFPSAQASAQSNGRRNIKKKVLNVYSFSCPFIGFSLYLLI
jgi:hypothetical protein